MLFMWGDQFKSLLIVTPRYLAALVTLSSLHFVMQFIRKDYRISLTGYSQYFTLVGIKFHRPVLLPFSRAWRSFWRMLASVDVLTVRYIIVSLAKSRTLLFTELGRSFRKRHGPNTDPWGTPDITGKVSDVHPSILTFWVRHGIHWPVPLETCQIDLGEQQSRMAARQWKSDPPSAVFSLSAVPTKNLSWNQRWRESHFN